MKHLIPESYVGNIPEPLSKDEAGAVVAQNLPPNNPEQKKISEDPVPQPTAKIQNDKLAWLNRIDFASEEAGKSALIIGTTRPVDYQLTKISDKRLRLDLLDTNLPEYRNRALITTRFQSAVDRITPRQQPETNHTIIVIELRNYRDIHKLINRCLLNHPYFDTMVSHSLTSI